MTVLLPSTYNGNLYFFHQLMKASKVMIEQHENFVKQSYRNRCTIYGANGKLDLIIPIVKSKTERTKTKTAKIDYSSNWQKIHWRSIESAYRRSPYFEYYEEKLISFYEQKPELLFDYNLSLLQFYLKAFQIDKEIIFTEEYHEKYEDMDDLRNHFDPKKAPEFDHPHYFQCFETKHGFIKNLSILDLLFNCGPQGISYLGGK